MNTLGWLLLLAAQAVVWCAMFLAVLHEREALRRKLAMTARLAGFTAEAAPDGSLIVEPALGAMAGSIAGATAAEPEAPPMDESKLHEAIAAQGMTAEIVKGPPMQPFEVDGWDPELADGGVRARVFAVMLNNNSRAMAAEEIADMIGVEMYRVTPRLFELEQAGRIVRADERHTNRSGKTAARFRLATAEETAAKEASA